MFGNYDITVYTLIAIGFISFMSWLVWKNTKARITDNSLSDSVVTFTGVGGILIASCSFLLSASYGFSIGGNHSFLPVVYAVILASISIAEFVSAYWVESFLSKRNAIGFIVSMALMVTGVVVSIMAGQALIASQVDEVKSGRLHASDSYKFHQSNLANAQLQASQLAVSKADHDNALSVIESNMATATAYIATYSTYSDCANYPAAPCTVKGRYHTKTNELNSTLSRFTTAIKSSQSIIDRYNGYNGALENLKQLESKPMTAAIDAELPHVKWLAVISGIEPELIEARLYITLAIISELVGLILLYFYGKGTRQTSDMQPAKVTLNQVPAMEIGGYVHSDGLAYLHGGERVLTAQQTREWHEWQRGNAHNSPPIDTAHNRPPIDTAHNRPPIDTAHNSPPIDTAHNANRPPIDTAHNARVETQIVYQGIDRVPMELSQIKGRGRVKKLDACVKCGSDYVVGIYNQLCCKKCSEENQKSYAMRISRKA